MPPRVKVPTDGDAYGNNSRGGGGAPPGQSPLFEQSGIERGSGRRRRQDATERHPHCGWRSVAQLGRAQLVDQRLAACFWMADLRLAAWFLWMTPLLTALSNSWPAVRAYSWAFSTSPA